MSLPGFVLNPHLGTVEVLLDVFLIQSAVLVVLFFLSRNSAATQHLLLSVSVVMVLVVTTVSPLIPSRALGILPVGMVETAVRGSDRSGFVPDRVEEGETAAVEAADPASLDTGSSLPALGLIWSLGSLLLMARLGCGRIRAFTLADTYEEYLRYREPFRDMQAFRVLGRFGQRLDTPSREEWHPADPAREYYGFDPMEAIRSVPIPILAVFGERDTQVDPVQGAEAYREALSRGGNPPVSWSFRMPTTTFSSPRQAVSRRGRTGRGRGGGTTLPPTSISSRSGWRN